MNIKNCHMGITIALGLVIIIMMVTNHNLVKENQKLKEKVSGTKVVLDTCPCCGADDAYLHMTDYCYYIQCDKCHYKTTGYTNLTELINDWNDME